MTIRYGANEILDVYYGSNRVSRVYYGTEIIWPTTAPPPIDPITPRTSQAASGRALWANRVLSSVGFGDRAVTNARRNIAAIDSSGNELSIFVIESRFTSGGVYVYYPTGQRSTIPNTFCIRENDGTIHTIDVGAHSGGTQVTLADGTTLECDFATGTITGGDYPANTEYLIFEIVGGSTTYMPFDDSPPTNFNVFSAWLQAQSDVLAYVQLVSANYTFPFTAAFTNVYFNNNMIGMEVSNWNSATYPIIYMRIRGQLETAGTTVAENRYLIRLNRDISRSGNNVIPTYHNIPGTGNYSSSRVFHFLDFDRQRQIVLGNAVGEVDAVRDNSIDFHATHGDMIDYGGATVGQFFTDLDDAQNMLIVVAAENWRPWS